MLIGDIVTSCARLYPDKIAFIDEGGRLTWAQFNNRVNRLTHALIGLGLKKGDRAAFLSENRNEYAEFLFAAAKSGIISVCLNYRLTADQLMRIVDDCQPSAMIIEQKYVAAAERVEEKVALVIGIGKDHGCTYDYEKLLAAAPSLEPHVELAEHDVYRVNYTTGTTGTSKGVMITHKNELTNCIMRLQATATTHDDVVLNAAPLFAAGVQCRFFGNAFLGCTTVITSFSAESFVKMVERERVTYASLLPTTFRMVKEYLDRSPARFDLSSLRKLQPEGGQHCSGEDLREMLDYFKIPYGNSCKPYGMTESMPTTYLIPEDVAACLSDHATPKEKRRLDSVGKSLFNCQVRIVDEEDRDVGPGEVGEIIVKGDQVMKGYWNNPELTRKKLRNGWFYTADLGFMDEAGYLFFACRKDFVIKTGGLMVGPEEVEAVIMKHPVVSEVAVIGLKDQKWGQVVTAVVCLKEGSTVTTQEIMDFCRQRLAGFQVPKRVEFVKYLPRDVAYRKINRLALIRAYQPAE